MALRAGERASRSAAPPASPLPSRGSPSASLPRSARGSFTSRSARVRPSECQALDLPDSPFLPEEVQLYREAARQRTDELKGIFASRNSEEVKELRTKLKMLDAEESALKESIQRLREDLDELKRERLAKARDGSEGFPSDGMQPTSSMKIEEHEEEEEAEESDASDAQEEGNADKANPEDGSSGEHEDGAGSPGGTGARASIASSGTAKFRGMSKMYNGRESLSPILNRRRAEVRFREAELAHDQNIVQMRSGIAELERRMQKQQQHMQKIDKEVLSAELTKVKYKVRFDKAEQRIKSLSQDLSHAYDKIATLLGDRLRAEDAKARNDALVSYLGTIRSADLENEFNFLPNREEVLQLLHCHKRSNANFDTLDALEAEVANKIQLSRHIEGHCKEMLRLVAGMQGMWNTVPTALRESVFVRGRGGSVDVHPVSAMVQISEALKIVMDMLQEHKAKMMIVIQHQTEEASPVSSRKIRLP